MTINDKWGLHSTKLLFIHWCHCKGNCYSFECVDWGVCVCVYFSHFQMEKERRKDGLPLEDRYAFFRHRENLSCSLTVMFESSIPDETVWAHPYTWQIMLAFTAAQGWLKVSTSLRVAPGNTSSISPKLHIGQQTSNSTQITSHRRAFCSLIGSESAL